MGKKVSAMEQATELNANDSLYVVHNGESRKVSLTTFSREITNIMEGSTDPDGINRKYTHSIPDWGQMIKTGASHQNPLEIIVPFDCRIKAVVMSVDGVNLTSNVVPALGGDGIDVACGSEVRIPYAGYSNNIGESYIIPLQQGNYDMSVISFWAKDLNAVELHNAIENNYSDGDGNSMFASPNNAITSDLQTMGIYGFTNNPNTGVPNITSYTNHGCTLINNTTSLTDTNLRWFNAYFPLTTNNVGSTTRPRYWGILTVKFPVKSGSNVYYRKKSYTLFNKFGNYSSSYANKNGMNLGITLPLSTEPTISPNDMKFSLLIVPFSK